MSCSASARGMVLQRSSSCVSSKDILEQGYFTMVLLVDISACTVSFPEIADKLDAYGTERGLAVRIQREDIFNAMHRI